MKILLTAVNAKYIHSNLAVYSLRAYAKEYADSVEIAEYTINHQSEYILQEIYKKNPDVLCFSCYIWNYDYVQKIAARFHKLRKDVPIWVGGPEVSYEIEKVFAKNPSFFGVIIGEGEASFAELAAYYCGGERKPLSQVAGIAYRCGKIGEKASGICVTAPREALDLSTVPFAYEKMEDFENRIVYYESGRGCPFSCSYCLSSVDRRLRFRRMDLVKQELSFFMEKKVLQVKFVDRTFNCNHAHAMEIFRFLKENDNGVTNFHFEIAADLLDGEELKLLSTLRPGLVQFEIGVQSINPKTICEIRRSMQLPKVASAVQTLQRAGNIHIHLDLIAGLPYEGYESFTESFRYVYALKPNQLQLGFLKVLKGSYMYENREAYGLVFWDEPPYEVMQTKWLSYDEMLLIKLAEEMLEIYYNSGQFEVTMKLADAVYKDSFGFFLSLGQFYEKKGCLGKNHSRLQRSELLLEFLLSDAKMPKDLVEESILYDLYYRENIKRRPSFAKNPANFSKISKIFCKDGKLSHIEPFFYHFPGKEERSIKKLPERLLECVYVLFEYEKRDALTYQAKTTEYTSREVWEKWENAQKRF